jgi:hypothetical protein
LGEAAFVDLNNYLCNYYYATITIVNIIIEINQDSIISPPIATITKQLLYIPNINIVLKSLVPSLSKDCELKVSSSMASIPSH